MSAHNQTKWRPKLPVPFGFLGLFALFAAMTAILFWQWMPHLHSALIGPPEDNMQDFWNTWYASRCEKPRRIFLYQYDTVSGRYALILSFLCLSESLCHSAVIQGYRHRVAVLALPTKYQPADFFSLGWCWSILSGSAFHTEWVGALTGGFVFAFNPSHVAHVMHHAHVSSIEFIPFFVLSYLVAIERKSIIWLGLAIAFYGLSALSCWYYLFYIAYFIAFHTVYTVIRDRAFPRGWSLLAPIACLAGVVIVLSPLSGSDDQSRRWVPLRFMRRRPSR